MLWRESLSWDFCQWRKVWGSSASRLDGVRMGSADGAWSPSSSVWPAICSNRPLPCQQPRDLVTIFSQQGLWSLHTFLIPWPLKAARTDTKDKRTGHQDIRWPNRLRLIIQSVSSLSSWNYTLVYLPCPANVITVSFSNTLLPENLEYFVNISIDIPTDCEKVEQSLSSLNFFLASLTLTAVSRNKCNRKRFRRTLAHQAATKGDLQRSRFVPFLKISIHAG